MKQQCAELRKTVDTVQYTIFSTLQDSTSDMMRLIIKKGVFMDLIAFLCNNLLYGVKTHGEFWRFFSGKKMCLMRHEIQQM